MPLIRQTASLRCLMVGVLLCIAAPVWAYDPCLGPLQAALDVQALRDAESQMRADFAAKIKIAPIGAVGPPPDRDAELLAEYETKAATAAACAAASAAGHE